MSDNILILNYSKTEFLLTELKQLAKMHNSSLNIFYSSSKLGFVLDEQLISPINLPFLNYRALGRTHTSAELLFGRWQHYSSFGPKLL